MGLDMGWGRNLTLQRDLADSIYVLRQQNPPHTLWSRDR
jgi:hypothetical protein